jgi:hypothetical protein
MAPRLTFITTLNPAVLRIENVQEEDAGEYRCRVDFRNSPTRNSKVTLKIL